jgi:hypothetical protein
MKLINVETPVVKEVAEVTIPDEDFTIEHVFNRYEFSLRCSSATGDININSEFDIIYCGREFTCSANNMSVFPDGVFIYGKLRQ